MTKRRIVILFFSILIFTACSARPAETLKLKVGILPIADCLQFFVAKDKGFFQGEGLEIEFVEMAGGAQLAPAVESGEIDIAFSNLLSLAMLNESGSDFKIIAGGAFKTSANEDYFNLLVTKESGVDVPKDLEGKTLAVNTRRNIVDLTFEAWAKENGLDSSKVNIVTIPFPMMESALENNEIDAAFMVEPYQTLILANNSARKFSSNPLNTVGEKFLIGAYFAETSWIEKHPKEAQAFIGAIDKASDYIAENHYEAANILISNTRLTPEIVGRMTWPILDDDVEKNDIEVVLSAGRQFGFLTRPMELRELVSDYVMLK